MSVQLSDEMTVWFDFVVPTRVGAKIEVRAYEGTWGFATNVRPALWLHDLESGYEFASAKVLKPPKATRQFAGDPVPPPLTHMEQRASRVYLVTRAIVMHEAGAVSCALVLSAVVPSLGFR